MGVGGQNLQWKGWMGAGHGGKEEELGFEAGNLRSQGLNKRVKAILTDNSNS